MVHTSPDYADTYKMDKIFSNMDNAELAARTGGISLFDRRGNFIWYDNFENGILDYKPSVLGGSTAHSINATHAWMNDSSMKLTAGPAVGNFTYLQKYVAPPPSNNIGVEIMFLMPAEKCSCRIGIVFFTATHLIESYLSYSTDTEDLSYYNSGGTFTAIDNVKLYQFANLIWVHMKFVIDITTQKYVRAIAGNTEYSLSNISPRVTAMATDPMLITSFGLICEEIADIDLWCDNFIITQNE